MLRDTLQAAERLKAGGFDEAHTRALLDLWAMAGGEEVTKQDLDLMEARLTSAIKDQRADLEAAIKGQRTDLETAIRDLEAAMKAQRADLEAAMKGLRTDLETAIRGLEAAMKEQRTDLETAIRDLEAAMKEQRADLETAIKEVQLETLRGTRNWVAGGVGLIALLMTLFEFIA